MKMKRLAAASVVALLAVAPLTACAQEDVGSGDETTKTLNLTTIMPMTGPAEIYGTAVVKMLDLVIADTNEAGGVQIAGETYELELTVLDDEMNPETAQTVSRQALEDGREIIIGPFGSGTANAVQPVMARGGAMWLLPIATVAGPTQNPNVFRTAALASAFMDPATKFLGADDSVKTVALFTDQTHTAHFSTIDQFTADLEGVGKDVVTSQLFSGGDTDFRAPLTQMLAQNPDVIIVRGYTAETILILQQLKELGSDAMVIVKSGTTTAETEGLVTDMSLLDNVYQSIPLTSLDPFVAADVELAKTLLERLDGKSGAADAYVYDAMQVLITALSQAASTSVDDIIAAMNSLEASDVEGKTLNNYAAQSSGLVFQDREVSLEGAVVEWIDGTGWTPVNR